MTNKDITGLRKAAADQSLRSANELAIPSGAAVGNRKNNRAIDSSPGHTILIVDDEKRVLNALQRLFLEEDYEIITAENATEALSAMAVNPVSLIVSDYRKPGLSGIEFLKKVREEYPQTIRLMLTGVTDADVVRGAINEGAVYKFINKPWNDDDLLVTVRLALAQYDLIRENEKLKRVTRDQSSEINSLTRLASIDRSTLGSVFTSLHTNSTVATISRLFHMEVAPYIVASAVQGIVAQRLVRKVCPDCRELQTYGEDLPRILGLDDSDLPEKLFAGAGCAQCNDTGYQGRVGLYEVFQMNEEFRQFLTSGYREAELLNMARSIGMESLLEDGKHKVIDGMTTLKELLRVLGPAVQYDYYCSKCKANLDIKYSACPYCGTAQRHVCKNCRGRLVAGWVACPYCGERDIA